ncbi:MAG: YkgJ family cysteine cluster protein [Pseudomonadota bacterium]
MKPKEVFDCQCCGVCCRGEGGIYLPPEDAAGPAGLLGIAVPEFIETYTTPQYGLLALRTDAEGFCLFHDQESHHCRIHPVKPRMCRDWPFFWGPLNDQQGFEDAKNACPGIPPGTEWEDFKAYHREAIKDMPPRSYIFSSPGDPDDQTR